MRKGTLQKGSISVANKPYRLFGKNLDCNSMDLETTTYIRRNPELEPYFEEVIKSRKEKNGDVFYVPCSIKKPSSPENRAYFAHLLAPPGTKRGSDKFVRFLIVPDLALRGVVGDDDDPVGFEMISEHLDGQKFYAPPIKPVKRLRRDRYVRYSGLIKDIPEEGNKNPIVFIGPNSSDNFGLFERNRKMLERIKRGDCRFWWDIVPDISYYFGFTEKSVFSETGDKESVPYVAEALRQLKERTILNDIRYPTKAQLCNLVARAMAGGKRTGGDARTHQKRFTELGIYETLSRKGMIKEKDLVGDKKGCELSETGWGFLPPEDP